MHGDIVRRQKTLLELATDMAKNDNNDDQTTRRSIVYTRLDIDPDTELPHIYGHGVTEEEVIQVMRSTGVDFQGSRGSLMKIAWTSAGRYLQVIYIADEEPDSVFVITPYELKNKAKRAFRRRRRRNT